jgi:poly(3-hydroxybutyrate) depolymerase
MLSIIRALLALLLCLAAAPIASAEMVQRTGTFGGVQLTYKVVLPSGYDPAKSYPTILVFTGGPQQLQGAERTLEADWRAEAERRGYVVISPGTPDGSLFFQGADRVFPEFLDFIVREYRVRPGALHVAGHSNGGTSAFHVAARYPTYFATLTGYPGLLQGADVQRAAALKSMCVFMHVGERDSGWRDAMREQAQQLQARGVRVTFTVEPNQVHRLRAGEINLSPRLFGEIEGCRAAAR